MEIKQIPLSRGLFAIVDGDDFEYLNQWKWYCSATGYAIRKEWLGNINGKRTSKVIRMHRFVSLPQDGLSADHINGNKLDNRRGNLRNCTHKNNMRNIHKLKPHSSKYKGVSWDRFREKWKANITVDAQSIYLGRFTSEEDAATAYNFAAIKQYGEYAKLNGVAA